MVMTKKKLFELSSIVSKTHEKALKLKHKTQKLWKKEFQLPSIISKAQEKTTKLGPKSHNLCNNSRCLSLNCPFEVMYNLKEMKQEGNIDIESCFFCLLTLI